MTEATDLARAFVDRSRRYLVEDFLPRIRAALGRLSEDDLWWRPNEASNSAGNLVLHLCGNARQWMLTRSPNAARTSASRTAAV